MSATPRMTWFRERAGKLFVIGAGVLLACSLSTLIFAVFIDRSDEVNATSAELIASLEGKRDAAADNLNAVHTALVKGLPGVDLDRTERDADALRDVMLSVTDLSASARDDRSAQAMLDSRYEFWDTSSRTLTEFVPDWLATARAEGVPQVYTMSEFEPDMISVNGADFRYFGVARFDAVSTEAAADAEAAVPAAAQRYVLFVANTTAAGQVSGFEAYVVSSETRDALAEAKASS